MAEIYNDLDGPVLRTRYHHYRKHLAVAKVFFDMYDGYTYNVITFETDPLVRFHYICSLIDRKCAEMRITARLELPNGMTIIPTYIPLMEDGHLRRIEVAFNLEMHGIELGRVRDIVCAYDSFALDLGHIILGSGLPYKEASVHERSVPLCIEIMKMVDSVTRDAWPCWKGTYPLKRGYKGPLLGWSNDPLYTINGIRRTVMEWSDIMGVNPLLVQRELDDGLTIEEALKEAESIQTDRPKTRKPSRHIPAHMKLYEYKGRTATLYEWAATLDIPPATLRTRMSRGMTFAEAYEYGNSHPVEINGEWKYISDWCSLYRINQKKVAALIRDGMSPKDAILTARLRAAEAKKEKERKKLEREGWVSPQEIAALEANRKRRKPKKEEDPDPWQWIRSEFDE